MKGFSLLISQKFDEDLPFKPCPLFDINVKSLDAASALLHMIAQTCADESKLYKITLINLDEDETK